ncbi:MAG: hypothetical protein KAT16_02400 [Candidatus Heimdallarchaeota archaeon]|nr:hypothetical protein [Candidatus Heimdallarchaeota archaeon]
MPLLILGPRGFGKSELFSLFIEKFDDNYIRFVPVASDGIIFQQDSRGRMLSFKTKGKHVSIRGKDNIDWERKIAVEATFDKEFQTSIAEFNFGILIVGALGLERMSKTDYNEMVKKQGHRLNFQKEINLIRVEDPKTYLTDLIRDMIQQPAQWRQLELYDGKLSRIESEFRLVQKIVEYLPYRVLELTLPEDENKWGQLRDVFKAVVRKVDRLIISTVEYKLSTMIRRETSNLIHRIQHEWKFPEDRQLPRLDEIPEILLINKWLKEKVIAHGDSLDLPPNVIESIESGILSIRTAFVEDLGSALKPSERMMTPEELQKMVTVHSIAVGELMTELSQETFRNPVVRKGIKETKNDIDGLGQFLGQVMRGEI